MRFKRLLMILPMLLLDTMAMLFSGFLTAMLLQDSHNWQDSMTLFLDYFPILVVSGILIFYFLGLYAGVWGFAGIRDVMRVVGGGSLLTVTYIIGNTFWLTDMRQSMPFYLIFAILFVFFAINIRMYARYKKLLTRLLFSYSKKTDRILIIGGGVACHIILSEIASSTLYAHAQVVGIIDDDPLKRNMRINGYKIFGGRDVIAQVVEKQHVTTIIFAIPSCPDKDRTEILSICQETGCQLKTLPTLQEFPNKFHISHLRNVEIEDLLGRQPVKTDLSEVMGYVTGKRVLVTGGGGSIGSELCRQIAAYHPEQLILLDIYENTTYETQLELQKKFPDLHLTVRIGSICDEEPLDALFEEFKPHIVYHAAAHKHVPLMEDVPAESIRNNVFGTLNTVKAADKWGVERFVMISTDKAVNPTNVMGATKRICEMIIQSYNKRSDTEYVAVRFGNVLGSHGSVIPLFRRQLAEGGPLTVTHPDIIRYFMTIPEAVSLVLQAGALAKGGEIFVLDMGKPVKIVSLAENLIRLSGLEPYKDIEIRFTGLRPGEKLYEELLMDEEGLSSTANELIHIGKPMDIDPDQLFEELETLREKLSDKDADFREEIGKIVPTYHPAVCSQ